MGTLPSIGNMTKYVARTEGWGHGMNLNIIAMSMMMSASFKSMTTGLPETASEGDMYISPADGTMNIWQDSFDDGTAWPAQWWTASPKAGVLAFVEDIGGWFIFTEGMAWERVFDLPHNAVEREFSFYAPGLLRPSATLFSYIAGMEFTIEAGAPDSGAVLEVAPGSDLSLSLTKGGAQFGTITFSTGSTTGSVNVAAETIIQPATPAETQFVKANQLSVISPANVFGASGLTVTLRGKIRSID